MGITTALNNALSGLTAASRSAEVVSSNLANANTDGFSRREIELSARTAGGISSGVQVTGVTRQVNEVVLADRRLADSRMGAATVEADFYGDLERLIGTPDQPNGLTQQLAEFESALIISTSQPDSLPRLQSVAMAGNALTSAMHEISDGIQDLRLRADNAIEHTVENLNANLTRIRELNVSITRLWSSGQDTNALMDQRQIMIDEVAQEIPVSVLPRENGQIALYSQTGAALVDSTAASFAFSKVGTMTAYQSAQNGDLSGLTLNGLPLDTGNPTGPVSGGRLAALFAVRDDLGPGAQQQIDALARDMMERFEGAQIDPTLSAGDPGLFTDDGAAFDPAQEVGLAKRLTLNAIVDPEQGGDATRLRDGLGASAGGDVGDAAQLLRWADALGQARVPSGGVLGSAARTASGLASDFLSGAGSDKQTAEANLVHRRSQSETLTSLELRNGVDSDAELQKLLVIERSYSANAKVIQAVDAMLQTLMGI